MDFENCSHKKFGAKGREGNRGGQLVHGEFQSGDNRDSLTLRNDPQGSNITVWCALQSTKIFAASL
jgi:hypothetical protein